MLSVKRNLCYNATMQLDHDHEADNCNCKQQVCRKKLSSVRTPPNNIANTLDVRGKCRVSTDYHQTPINSAPTCGSVVAKGAGMFEFECFAHKAMTVRMHRTHFKKTDAHTLRTPSPGRQRSLLRSLRLSRPPRLLVQARFVL